MSDPRYPKRSGPGDYDDLVDTPRHAATGGQSDDPLAELARLIDEDPFADFNQRRQEPPLSQAPARTAFTEPPVEVPAEQYDTDADYDDATATPADSLYSDQAAQSQSYDQAQSYDPEAEVARPSGGYDLPDYEPPAYEPPAQEPQAYEPPAYEPPAYEPPAPAPESYRAPVASKPTRLEPDFDAETDAPGSAVDDDSTERLYADLAAASQRVEPTLDRTPARTEVPEASPAPAPAPGRYDPTADLEASLLAGATEPEIDEFDFGDLTGGAAAAPAARAETRDPVRDLGGAAYADSAYEQTDPVFDDSGHIPPYDGEVPVESSGRGRGMVIVAGLVGLVVLGGAGAFAYRSFTGGESDGPAPVIRADKSPSKVQPQDSGSEQAPEQGKLVYDRVSGKGKNEDATLVSREEAVADVGNRQVRVIDPNQENGTGLRGTAADSGSNTGQGESGEDLPKRVRTVVVKPDGTIVGEIQAPKPAEPLQAAPLPSNNTAADPASEAAPVATTESGDTVPLPQPRPAELAMSQPAATAPAPASSAPASTAPANTAPAPAPAQSSQPAANNQPGSSFVPPAAPTSRAAGGEPIQLQPAPAASTQAAPAQTAPAPTQTQPTQTASAPATTTFPAGSYVVQVAASRNEQDARSTAASISQNYSSALSGYSPAVERADLGDRGIYYRVGVGPLNSQSSANSLCAKLKSSGLDCFVRRN